MLQLSLREPILPQLRRNPPPLAPNRIPIANLPRPIRARVRNKNLPARRQHPRICALDAEVPQHVASVWAWGRADGDASEGAYVRHRHPR